jgi:lipoate-protein ligase A
MDCLTLPFSRFSPAELLAVDEVALEATEQTGQELFWTWEAATPWAVVGLGQSVSREVNLAACTAANIPVFRRCSGGGAVVQGPGCLNYAVTLRWERDPELASITGTNRWIMNRQRAALQSLVALPVAVCGHTDLALGPENHRLKFSGNAQRRRRTALLFHGTLLNTFDLALLARCLQHPSAEPEYRAGRPHSDFITNLNLAPADLRQALTKAWEVTGSANSISEGAVADLAATRFARADWIFRR